MTRDICTVGCDPETMWYMQGNKAPYQGILPAKFIIDRLGKVWPDVLNTTVKGAPAVGIDAGTLFADGASWELNPNPGTPDDVVDNMEELLRMSKAIEKRLEMSDRTIRLRIYPSVDFDINMLKVWDDPELMQFGCDPDKSIWPREVDPSKIDASTHSTRYCGGHIHIGYPTENPLLFYEDMSNLYKIVLLCDGILGLAGLCFDRLSSSSAHSRRKVYGQPGVYRIQPWGVEYRTPSNLWMRTKSRAKTMLTLASFIPSLLDTPIIDFLDSQGSEIRKALIKGDYLEAIKTLRSIRNSITVSKNPDLNSILYRVIDCVNNYCPLEWEKGWYL